MPMVRVTWMIERTEKFTATVEISDAAAAAIASGGHPSDAMHDEWDTVLTDLETADNRVDDAITARNDIEITMI